MRQALAAKGFKDINAFAKSYIELEGSLGNSLRFPSKEANDADRAAFRGKVIERGKDYGVTAVPDFNNEEEAGKFHNAIGRPEKADFYTVPEIAEVDGLKFDASEAEALRPAFHKAGITQRQFETLIRGVAEMRLGAAKERQGVVRANGEKIKTAWGEAAPTKTAQVAKWLELNKAPANLVASVKASQVDAESLFWLHGLMQGFGGETTEIAGQQGSRTTLTPSELWERVGEVERKINNLMPGDPEYQRLVEERIKLIERAGAS